MSKTVAVIGSGMMGRGIAACMVAGGPHEVRLYARKADALPEAAQKVNELVQFLVDNGVAAPSCGRLVTTSSLQEAVKGAEFVFESIAEDIGAKQKLFAELDELADAATILCTNNSSLSVTDIASGCKGAGSARVMAAHFIGPAHLVPLVELCPAKQTAGSSGDDGPVQRVHHFLQTIGKRPIILKQEIDGFIAARLQAALYRECLHIYQSGVADPDAIDGAVYNGFGRRLNQIGPFIQADFAGVDLVQNTHAKFFPQLGSYQRDIRADELVKEGRRGVKSLHGHYKWTDEKVKEVAGRRDAELLRRLKVDMADKSRL